jgi:hypothetical protein
MSENYDSDENMNENDDDEIELDDDDLDEEDLEDNESMLEPQVKYSINKDLYFIFIFLEIHQFDTDYQKSLESGPY